MWIGRPGALREIKDGASSFDRSPDLNVSEFRALSGGVTTWAPPVQPRRLKLGWGSMEPGDVRHLDRLARRLDGPGPIAVVDPLAGSMLGGHQGDGTGSPSAWSWSGSDIELSGGTTGTAPVTATVKTVPASNGPDLFWQHPRWYGFPVAPGMVVTWWAPGLVAAGAPVAMLRIQWIDAAGAVTGTATQNGTAPLVQQVPVNTAYARPVVRFSALGAWPIGRSVLALGDVSSALVAGDVPHGEGSPPYSITRYGHGAAPGDGRWRDISLELVEVAQ
ncbi:hypothetical protein AB0G74_12705 [Streptomyces sp. NPDC020875]|uniref:hypothetical protein n=1 Tax=Streptomyces sp. NPDC020875 TaxID=3154898 RepID=UPI0033D58CD6